MEGRIKEKILQDLKIEVHYQYLIEYKTYLYSKDCFFEFNCEREKGKGIYLSVLKDMVKKDKTFSAFVEYMGWRRKEKTNGFMQIY